MNLMAGTRVETEKIIVSNDLVVSCGNLTVNDTNITSISRDKKEMRDVVVEVKVNSINGDAIWIRTDTQKIILCTKQKIETNVIVVAIEKSP